MYALGVKKQLSITVSVSLMLILMTITLMQGLNINIIIYYKYYKYNHPPYQSSKKNNTKSVSVHRFQRGRFNSLPSK